MESRPQARRSRTPGGSPLLRRGMSLLAIAPLLVLVSCATNPVTGKRQLMLMTAAQEQQLGAESDQQIVAQYGLVQDESMAELVRSVGQQLVPVSHIPDQQFNFRLLDDPIVNAFALPGGYVYLTRGILAYLNDEAAMAGVMGHEIGHVAARHSARRYTQQQLYGLGLGLGSMLSETVAKYADLAGTALGLLMLKYSRDDEREADRLGVEYATKVGFDTREMALFFHTLDQLMGDGRLPVWQSTHPDPGERYQTVLQLTAEWQAQVPRTQFAVDRDAYLRRLEGLIFGDNPRQGYVKNSMFMHPELRLRFPVPSQWKVQNTATQVVLAPSDGQAAIIFSLDAKHTDPEAAAQEFAGSSGIQVVSRRSLTINGLPASRVVSNAQSDQGTVGVVSTFIGYGGKVYVFHGFAAATGFAQAQPTLQSAADGFGPLSDPAALNIQPVKLHIITADRTATFAELVSAYPIPEIAQIDVAGLAVVNGVGASDTITRGTLLKVLKP